MFRFCVNGAYRYFQQYGNRFIRFKHNESLIKDPELTSSENSYWFLRPENSTPLESDRRLLDTSSFDDFGVLSLDRSKSTDTVSTLGEKSFIDNLLRYDSYNAYDGSIPTTVDMKELGETGDGIEELEVLCSEGFDVSAVIKELRGTSSALPANFIENEPVEESSNAPYLIPKNIHEVQGVQGVQGFIPYEKPATRMHIGSRRRVNRLLHPTDSSTNYSILPTPSPDISNKLDEIPERFDSTQRFEKCTIEELEKALRVNDIVELRKLLMLKSWPPIRDMGALLIRAFDFIVQNSRDTDEALMFFRDFASFNRRSYVRDEAVVELAVRAVNEGGVVFGTRLLSQVRDMFLTKAPMSSSKKMQSSINKLYVSAFEKGTMTEAKELFQTVLEKGYASDVEPFMRLAAQHMLKNQSPYQSFFACWSQLATNYSSVGGYEYLLQCTLKNNNEIIASKQTEEVLKFVKMFAHPFDAIANIICTYVRFGNFEQAGFLMKKLSISGKYFKIPIRRLSEEDEGLLHVEQLSKLVTACMYGEKRRGKRGKQNETIKDTAISEPLMKVIDRQCGTTFTLPPKLNKKEKKKMHKVDDEQLHELSLYIQDVWISLAEKRKDYASAERLLTWCQLNRVDISNQLSKRVSQLKQ